MRNGERPSGFVLLALSFIASPRAQVIMSQPRWRRRATRSRASARRTIGAAGGELAWRMWRRRRAAAFGSGVHGRRCEVEVHDWIVLRLLHELGESNCSFARTLIQLRAPRLVRRAALELVALSPLLAAHVPVAVCSAKREPQACRAGGSR